MSLGTPGTGETRTSAELAEREVAPRAPSRFDVVALVTSTGGLEALRRILRDLPRDFQAALVVAQHLGGQGSALVEILNRETKLPVQWASAGTRLMPGRVYACPPRRQL